MKIYKTLDDGVQIVEYEDSLAGALADMWNKSGDSWGGDNEIRTAAQIIGEHAGGSFFNVFVAVKDGEAVGYCSFDRFFKDENTAYVNLLNVRPDYHGKKIGKELVLCCVNQTIALGYPRVDINTWPGNTKAVPLYKKCGFLWEDRADSTHLQNFIPTVLKTALFSDFFAMADWYADSTRVIEIKPDGVKINNFEVFGYSWEKDGEKLAVSFEKTGRRIRLIETDDYRIEMTAENHELAFGLPYKCVFCVENKSGRELNLSIKGRDDGCVSFGYGLDTAVTGRADFEAEFFVNEIFEEQDPWRMHPCVLADISVNGKSAEFGLGIEPRRPVTISLVEKRQIPRPGLTEDVFINIKNSLPGNARVKFTLPENGLTKFHSREFSADILMKEDAEIAVKADIIACGYESLPVEYEITLEDGRQVRFSRPLHIVNQGLEGRFFYETEKEFGATNGLFQLRLNKTNNSVAFGRIIPFGGAQFNATKLGKPYDDEFNLKKPADVRAYKNGDAMVFEADFVSDKFKGAVLTEIYEFSAAGALNRRHRVENRGDITLRLFVKSEFWTNVGGRAVFHYDGGFHEIRDNMEYGFSDLNCEKIDENWIFDFNPKNPCGVMWPPEYKPFTKWGDSFVFEHDTGELKPGESYETKPVAYISGVFRNFSDFRNYALGIYEEDIPFAQNYLEIIANGYNPVFGADELPLEIRNNRSRIFEGKIAVSSENGAEIENTADGAWTQSSFSLPLKKDASGISLAKISMRFAGFETEERRAFLSKNADSSVICEEKDGVFTVKNGALSFSAAPEYSDALFSMKCGENEWLFSKYPAVEPYAWWNPFIGGLQTTLSKMSNSLIRREEISADFASERDSFGNLWEGVSTRVVVKNFEEHKGVEYTQYFLTMPGVPMLCYFVRVKNGTGSYRNISMESDAFICGKENLSSLFASYETSEREKYRLRMGKEDHWQGAGRMVRFSYEGEMSRAEKLYIFKDAERDGGGNRVSGDINSASYVSNAKISLRNGDSRATRPAFFILTEKELSAGDLKDFERLTFANETVLFGG